MALDGFQKTLRASGGPIAKPLRGALDGISLTISSVFGITLKTGIPQ